MWRAMKKVWISAPAGKYFGKKETTKQMTGRPFRVVPGAFSIAVSALSKTPMIVYPCFLSEASGRDTFRLRFALHFEQRVEDTGRIKVSSC
jgi:hypothetical protein